MSVMLPSIAVCPPCISEIFIFAKYLYALKIVKLYLVLFKKELSIYKLKHHLIIYIFFGALKLVYPVYKWGYLKM